MERKRISLFILLTLATLNIAVFTGCSNSNTEPPYGFVFVQGGAFVNTTSNLYGTDVVLYDFFISRYAITQREWVEIMGENPSRFLGDDRPVESVNWYDAILFANKRSIQEGLVPFYNIDMENDDPNNFSEEDDFRWIVTINDNANGFRLPTEVEWEYAAGGGQLSISYSFSGSDDPNEVAWYFRNSGDEFLEDFWNWPMIEANNAQTNPVGQKKPNELGIYDMSGNVREWVWDWFCEDEINPESGETRVIRGGGWIGSDDPCRTYERRYMSPHFRFHDIGFRLVLEP
ncbi:MAG: formylglycine-generating enzyme family protein [Defluviitaleaceae bacterium]|nr:formylglycine-generating enzyme family protein [Defluviitaleaceae bacterium]